MTVDIRSPVDLDKFIADCVRRGNIRGRRRKRWTQPQSDLFESPYRITVWRGPNGAGKSVALAELVRRALGAELHWQRPGPQTIILVGKTWAQIGSTLKYLWETLDKRWFKESVRFEAGGLQGQRSKVFDIIDGPCRGGELRIGVFRAENLAGPRADVVVSDEPLPQDVYNELWPRLLGRGGRMYMGFTVTIGTSHKVDYLWDLIDNDTDGMAGELVTELTLAAVTLLGGIVPISWMTLREIQQFERGLSPIERDMRMGRTRYPRTDTAYFGAWGPHLIKDVPRSELIGWRTGIGVDHGSKPGSQRAILIAASSRGLRAHIHVMDEYTGLGRTTSQDDAAGVAAMLSRNGVALKEVDLWVGDRAHHGDKRGGKKSNHRLQAAFAELLGHNTERRGWMAKLPKPLRRMDTPWKSEGSVWEGSEMLNRMMAGDEPRLSVSRRCTALHEDLTRWEGSMSPTDPNKHGIDALRYIAVPMTERRAA